MEHTESPPDDFLTTTDAARLTGDCPEWVRKLADRGDLGPVRRTGRGVRLLERSHVERFVAEREARRAQRQGGR